MTNECQGAKKCRSDFTKDFLPREKFKESKISTLTTEKSVFENNLCTILNVSFKSFRIYKIWIGENFSS